MSPRLRYLSTLLVALGLLIGCSAGSAEVPFDQDARPAADPALAEGVTVTVHRTATCACCGAYEDVLAAAGFTVEPVIHDSLTEVKARFGIPADGGSCHTNEVAGYAAEGHVPVEALLDLLAERPDINGVTLPGMPSGSPGMPGEQTEPFVVQAFVDGEVVGEFGRY